jgi:hypothetical protein
MVAEHQKRFFFNFFGEVGGLLPREDVFILVGPDPFDLFLVPKVRNIVGPVTGLYGLLGGLLIKLIHIHHQGPSFS